MRRGAPPLLVRQFPKSRCPGPEPTDRSACRNTTLRAPPARRARVQTQARPQGRAVGGQDARRQPSALPCGRACDGGAAAPLARTPREPARPALRRPLAQGLARLAHTLESMVVHRAAVGSSGSGAKTSPIAMTGKRKPSDGAGLRRECSTNGSLRLFLRLPENRTRSACLGDARRGAACFAGGSGRLVVESHFSRNLRTDNSSFPDGIQCNRALKSSRDQCRVVVKRWPRVCGPCGAHDRFVWRKEK